MKKIIYFLLIMLFPIENSIIAQSTIDLANASITASNCLPVQQLKVSNIAGTSAYVSWVPNGTSDTFCVKLSETDSAMWTSFYTTDPNFILTNLMERTDYTVQVYPICSGVEGPRDTIYFSTICKSGGDLIIGTPSATTNFNGNHIPSSTNYYYSYTQQIFDASELVGIDSIHSIAFQFCSGINISRNLTIFLGHTTQSTFSNTSNYIPFDSLTQVFQGTVSFNNSAIDNWFTIPFTNEFIYDGIRNIVLVVRDLTGPTANYSGIFKTHNVSEDKSIYFYQYTNPINPVSPSASGNGVSNYRNNIKFSFPCKTLACYSPNAIVTDITYNSAEITIVPSASESSWEAEYKFTNDASWISLGMVTSPYTLSDLYLGTSYQIRIRNVCSATDVSQWTITTFTTECGSIDNLPYDNDFDNYSSSSYNIPTCWTRLSTNLSNPYGSYPYITTSFNTVSSPNALYFSSTSSTYSMIILPPLDSSISLDSLQLTFWGRIGSSNQNLIKVGVMTNPNDASTFSLVGTFTPIADTYEEFIVSFENYTGTGVYIAIKSDNIAQSTSNWFYIDNLYLDYIPTCPKPMALNATTTVETATLVWTEIGTAQEWKIEYGEHGFTHGQGTYATSSDTFIVLTNLIQNTNYEFYVRSICGEGDTSIWNGPFSFLTQALSPVPYIQPFDNEDDLLGYNIDNWTFGSMDPVLGNPANNIFVSLWYSSPIGFFSTTNIGPLDSNYISTFEYKLAEGFSPYAPPTVNSGYFIVAISTDFGVTYTNIDTVYNNGLVGYQTYETELSDYANEIIKLKITGVETLGSYFFAIDNLYVGPEMCPSLSNISVGNITYNSVEFSRTENGTAQEWEIEYGELGFSHGDGIYANSTDTVIVITNLTQNTNYEFYVRAICVEGDTSLWSGPFTFLTQAISPVPYVQPFDFEDDLEGYNMHYWLFGSGNAANGNPAPNIYINLHFGNASCVLITKNIGPIGSTNLASFEYKMANDSSPYTPPSINSGYFVVAISTDFGITFTNIDTVYNNGLAGYQTYETELSDYANDIIQLRITGIWSSGDYYLAIDNLYVGPAICPYLTNISAGNITHNSVELSWTENGTASEWQIEYGPSGFIQGTGTNVNTNSNPFTITSLNSGTNYDFYVRSVCDSGASSIWSDKVTAITTCLPVLLPLNEGFEVQTTIPSCWTTYSSGASFISSSMPPYTTHSGNKMLCYYSDTIAVDNYAVLFSPVIAFDGEPVEVSFWQFRNPTFISNIPEGVEVLYNSTASLTGAISLGFTADYYVTGGWYNVTYTIPAGHIGNYFIIFKVNSPIGRNQFIDDISIHCVSPSNLTIEGASSTSISVNWNNSTVASSDYIISYKVDTAMLPFDPENGIHINIPVGTPLPYVINGLNPGDSIWVSVRSVSCNNWANAQKIYMPSFVSTVPYFCNFEDSIQNLTWTLHNGSQINKWYIGTPGANGGIGNGLFISSNNGNTVSYNNSVNSKVMASTAIQFNNASEFELSFNWCAKGQEGFDYIAVYLLPLTYKIVPGNFLPDEYLISPALNGYTSWQTKDIVLGTQYSNTVKRLVFLWINNFMNGTNPPGLIDNIVITTNCVAPTNLVSSNIGTTSVDLSWMNDPSQTEFLIEYKLENDAIWNRINSNISTYQLTQLLPSSTYNVRIKAICAITDTSNASNTITFTTLCAPVLPPTALSVSNLTHSSATITWVPGGNETSWEIDYKPALSTTWNTQIANIYPIYYFNGLTPSTNYNVRIRSVCNGGINSDYSEIINFSTLGPPCLTPTALSVSNTTPSSATITWVPGGNETSWEIDYKPASSTTWNTQIANIYPIYYVNGLTTSTNYNVRIRSVCTDGINSNYSEILNFSTLAPPCIVPTNLQITNITNNSALITWTTNGNELSWEIAYKPSSNNTWNTQIVTVPSCNLNVLYDSTSYDVKVRAICGVGDTSSYSMFYNFITLGPPCLPPTTLSVFNITSLSASITWVPGGNETSWEIDYKPASSTTWNTQIANIYPIYYFNGLTPSTNYNVRVRSVCTGGINSNYSEIINFSTLASPCLPPTALSVSNMTLTSATITWVPSGNETQWQVFYKLLSSSTWIDMPITTSPSQLIQSLQPNSTYVVRVKALCSATLESDYTTSTEFTTAAESTFIITASANSFGTISPSGSVVVNAGDDQLFTLLPNLDCTVDSLIINDTPIPYTLLTYTFTNVTDNQSIIAIFSNHSSISDNIISSLVELFPNPTNSFIEIRVDLDQLPVKECRIFDVYGKLLKNISVISSITQIDVSDLTDGVYIVSMKSKKDTVLKKFVKF